MNKKSGFVFLLLSYTHLVTSSKKIVKSLPWFDHFGLDGKSLFRIIGSLLLLLLLGNNGNYF